MHKLVDYPGLSGRTNPAGLNMPLFVVISWPWMNDLLLKGDIQAYVIPTHTTISGSMQ